MDRVAEGWTPDVDTVIGQLNRMPCGEANRSGRGGPVPLGQWFNGTVAG